MPPEIVGEKIEPERLYDSVNLLLSLQARIIFLVLYPRLYQLQKKIMAFVILEL